MHHLHPPQNRLGFSLIELSIVVVIISFIIGGTLLGRELIHSANLRSSIQQIERYQGALVNFESRFDGLPGDLSNATFQMSTTNWPDLANGDGDGYLEDGDGDNTYNDLDGELTQFWYQLTASRMLEEQYDTSGTAGEGFPYTIFELNGIGVYGVNNTGNYFHYGLESADVGDAIETASALSPEEAYYIDEKIDDGLPTVGRVQAAGGTAFAGDPIFYDSTNETDNPPVETDNELYACIAMDEDAADPDSTASYVRATPEITCQLRYTIE